MGAPPACPWQLSSLVGAAAAVLLALTLWFTEKIGAERGKTSSPKKPVSSSRSWVECASAASSVLLAGPGNSGRAGQGGPTRPAPNNL